jgi:hypothetical protein
MDEYSLPSISAFIEVIDHIIPTITKDDRSRLKEYVIGANFRAGGGVKG